MTGSPTQPRAGDLALEASGYGKRYGRGSWILRDITLGVRSGSITALIGPNGSGKSTLMKGWIGFERPSLGHLAVGGIDPWRAPGAAIRRLGYVPQAASLYPDLTVDDHLSFAASQRPGFDRPTALRRLGDLGIAHGKQARKLSGGQQAQVTLALALGTRAPILLLDEPLASLDPLARREFLHVLEASVRADGITALLSSHVIADIEQACDHLLVLGQGGVLLDLSIADALGRYRVLDTEGDADSTTVARFPGSDGRLLTLITPEASIDLAGRPATLEEVVIGHLAASRTTDAQSEAV